MSKAYVPFDSRNHSLMYYGDEGALRLAINLHSNRIVHWAYIHHDRDEAEPHFHIILHINNVVNSEKVIQWFKEVNGGQNVFDQEEANKDKLVLYLTHELEEDKTHYDKAEIMSDDINYWLNRNLTAYTCLSDYMSGASLRWLCANYGREFILNMRKYMDACELIREEEARRGQDYEKA